MQTCTVRGWSYPSRMAGWAMDFLDDDDDPTIVVVVVDQVKVSMLLILMMTPGGSVVVDGTTGRTQTRISYPMVGGCLVFPSAGRAFSDSSHSYASAMTPLAPLEKGFDDDCARLCRNCRWTSETEDDANRPQQNRSSMATRNIDLFFMLQVKC